MKYIKVLCTLLLSIMLFACEDSANVASKNLSKAADNFEVNR